MKLFHLKLAEINASFIPIRAQGKVWGAGAGPGPSGYSVEKIQHSPDLVRKYFDNWHPTVIFEVVSAAIMAGFLHAADDKMRETINSELRWLYDNQVRFVGLIFHLIVSLLSMLP